MALNDTDKSIAQQLAKRLGLTYFNAATSGRGYILVVNNGRLQMQCDQKHPDHGPVWVDFTAGKVAHRRRFDNSLNQPLARAIGLSAHRTLNVIDATAGFARDAFVIASLGANVHMIEQSVAIASLVEDGLRRARKVDSMQTLMARLQLTVGDAVRHIPKLSDAVPADTIYLDPMYPNREKNAAAKKRHAGSKGAYRAEANNNSDLLYCARYYALRRVVVKRPKNAPLINRC